MSDNITLRKHINKRFSYCMLLFILANVAQADKTAMHSNSKPAGADAKTVRERQAVQAVYDRQAAAMMRKDMKGFFAPFTPDYQNMKYGNHLYTLGNLRQQLPGLIAKYPPGFQFKTTILKFKHEGTGAKATANYHLQVVRTDTNRHKQELWVSDTVSEDTWIQEGPDWKLQSSREIKFTPKKTPLAGYHPPKWAQEKTGSADKTIKRKAAPPTR